MFIERPNPPFFHPQKLQRSDTIDALAVGSPTTTATGPLPLNLSLPRAFRGPGSINISSSRQIARENDRTRGRVEVGEVEAHSDTGCRGEAAGGRDQGPVGEFAAVKGVAVHAVGGGVALVGATVFDDQTMVGLEIGVGGTV